MQPPEPTDEPSPVIEHFDRLSTSGAWTRQYAAADGLTYHAHVRRQRVLELLPTRLGHVVDVGCGPGVMVESVLERGGTFHGIDLSGPMVEEGKVLFGQLDGVSFEVGDIESIPLPDASCDQVICMGVIEYLRHADSALSEMARILRSGGSAAITVPKRRHIDDFTVKAMAPVRALGRRAGSAGGDSLPRLRLQPEELDAAAVAAGLVPAGGSQYHFTPFPYPLNRIMPSTTMKLNVRFERWHQVRGGFRSFFAHGYVGLYRKL